MRKTITSDGKSRNLKLDFDVPLNNKSSITNANGDNFPFILTGGRNVRFTGDIPEGEVFMDYEEALPAIKPMSLDNIVFVQQKDVEALNILAQQLGIKETIINRKQIELEEFANALKALESDNALKIDNNLTDAIVRFNEVNNTIDTLGNLTSNKFNETVNLIRMRFAEVMEAIKAHLEDYNPHCIDKNAVGLSNVDNTSDLDKPVSRAMQNALDLKLDKKEADDIRKEIKQSEKKVMKIHDGIANMAGGIAQLELPRGGKKNQLLAKNSVKDGDFKWVDAGAANIPKHNDTTNRDANDAHPMSAITGLVDALASKQATIDDLAEIRSNAEAGKSACDTIANYGDVVTHDADEFATASQGATADTALQPLDIIDNTSSTAANKALSANMGKSLQDQVNNLLGRSKYLSIWDCTTGLAMDEPPVNPYTVETGSFFIVGKVAEEGGTNYKPNGGIYDKDVPSTTVETNTVKNNDTYYYDGTVWRLLDTPVTDVAFSTLAGSPYDNTNLNAALSLKANTTDLDIVAFSGSYNDLSDLPAIPSKTSDLTNDSGFINKDVNNLTNYTTTTALNAALALKQGLATYDSEHERLVL